MRNKLAVFYLKGVDPVSLMVSFYGKNVLVFSEESGIQHIKGTIVKESNPFSLIKRTPYIKVKAYLLEDNEL